MRLVYLLIVCLLQVHTCPSLLQTHSCQAIQKHQWRTQNSLQDLSKGEWDYEMSGIYCGVIRISTQFTWIPWVSLITQITVTIMKCTRIFKVMSRETCKKCLVAWLVHVIFLSLYLGNWWGVDATGLEESTDLWRKEDQLWKWWN